VESTSPPAIVDTLKVGILLMQGWFVEFGYWQLPEA